MARLRTPVALTALAFALATSGVAGAQATDTAMQTTGTQQTEDEGGFDAGLLGLLGLAGLLGLRKKRDEVHVTRDTTTTGVGGARRP